MTKYEDPPLETKINHLITYILMLSNELKDLNKKLETIIDNQSKSIRVLILK